MKFAKGIFLGSIITAGIIMMCTENDMMNMNTKKMTKKGKQFARKMGLI